MVNRVHVENTIYLCKHRFLPRLIPYMARGERGVLLEIIGGVVPTGPQNPDPISD